MKAKDCEKLRKDSDIQTITFSEKHLKRFLKPSKATMLQFHQLTLVYIIAMIVAIEAYQPSSNRRTFTTNTKHHHHPEPNRFDAAATMDSVKNSLATLALSTILLTSSTCLCLPPAAFASDVAAQVSLDRLPPTSISIQIGDLPVVGSLLSGTYSKVADGSIKDPSITIKSPKDKVKAISTIATGGHLEFDVGGKISTHFDVDIAADEAGTAKVVVKSNLIPKLPFKNMANSINGGGAVSTSGGKESQWNIVTNLGNGETYYYNVKSGVTQFSRPDKI